MRAAQDDLEIAEHELQIFLQRNRSYKDSPALTFEASRLERIINLRQQVYTSLAQAHEQARLDEVRDTPVMTIVDSPAGSAEPTGHVASRVGFGLLIGFLLGAAAAMIYEYVAKLPQALPKDYEELRQATVDIRPKWLAKRSG